MKMVKSLILGSAAGLIAMSGAQAADLPVKAKAVEYVRICSLYGAGFFYIPGTDTCIKLGGYLRVETALNTNSVFGSQMAAPGSGHNRFANYYTARSREGQSGRIREDLLPLWCWFLVHPGHRHLHEDRRLSAR